MRLDSGRLLDGRYSIVCPLGSGGMGEVYQAKDQRLGRDVAIKVLPEHLAQAPDALARFEWEARVLAALSHPNIRAIHDLSKDGELNFAVMEYLEGDTLRQRLEGQRLALDEVLGVATEIAEGLAAAHAKGVIHRDLKPENIFFAAGGPVKILDFGLARMEERLAAGRQLPVRPLETQPGLVMGTASYMAPEQVRGEVLDARCDVFAFGCLLHEMITGNRVFNGGTIAEIVASVLKDEPASLSYPGSEIPPEVATLVEGCLEKDLWRRLQGMKEVAASLRAIRAGHTASGSHSGFHSGGLPSGGSGGNRAEDLTRGIPSQPQQRVLTGEAAPGAGFGRRWWRGLSRLWPFRSRAIRSLAVLPFINTSGDPGAEYLGDGIAETLIERLSRLPELRIASWSAVSRFKQADLDLPAVGRELQVRALLTGRVNHRGRELTVSAELVDSRDRSHLWGESYSRNFSDLLGLQQEISTRIAEKLRAKLSGEIQAQLAKAPTEDPEAFQLYLKGRHAWRKRTADALQKAVEHFQEAIDRDPNYALAYAGLADAYALLSFLVGVMAPLDALPRAKAAAERALDLDPGLADAYASMGMILESFEWDWTGAERCHRRALQLAPLNPNLHHRLGMHLLYRSRFDEAQDCFSKAQGLDPLAPLFHVGQGLPRYFQRNGEEAVREFKRATVLAPSFLIAHLMLGLALVQQGAFDEAILSFESANAIAQTPDGLAMLGHAHGRTGHRDEALDLLVRLKQMAATRYVSAYGLAVLHLGLGDRERALAHLELAVQQRCELLVYVGIDPRLDELRGDERFQGIQRRVLG
ncbi:MAG: protein kinase [Holophagaceae bacterium]|nr:protein kinase [Holophagaceae bacterium]